MGRMLCVLAFLACLELSASIKVRSSEAKVDTRLKDSNAQLSNEDLKGCSFEVVMFDTRPLADEPHFEGKMFQNQYVSLAAVINYLYAQKFGYAFNFVSMDKANINPKFSIPWHRVFYFADRLNEMKDSTDCTWFLYLDTDAFMRDFSTSIDSFIGNMASKYHIDKDVGAIFAQEQEHLPEMPISYHAINAGVYLVHANAQSQTLFNTWSAAANDDEELQKTWPAEQGVLTELAFPGKYMTRMGETLPDGGHKGASARLHQHDNVTSSLALVDMVEMNSPWGQFVEHVWSGPGSEKRGTDFMGMLQGLDAAEPDRFAELLENVRQHVSEWQPPTSS